MNNSQSFDRFFNLNFQYLHDYTGGNKVKATTNKILNNCQKGKQK